MRSESVADLRGPLKAVQREVVEAPQCEGAEPREGRLVRRLGLCDERPFAFVTSGDARLAGVGPPPRNR
jgi:hypothetical protein